VAWGAIDLVLAALAWRGLAERDVVGATKLDRLLWLNTGLNIGYIAVGVTLAVVGWQLGRRLGLVGAGLGVTVQGLALLVLDAHFLGVINRLAVR
jgi:sulfite exporter TauE/SafE